MRRQLDVRQFDLRLSRSWRLRGHELLVQVVNAFEHLVRVYYLRVFHHSVHKLVQDALVALWIDKVRVSQLELEWLVDLRLDVALRQLIRWVHADVLRLNYDLLVALQQTVVLGQISVQLASLLYSVDQHLQVVSQLSVVLFHGLDDLHLLDLLGLAYVEFLV